MGDREKRYKLRYRSLNILICLYTGKKFCHEIGLFCSSQTQASLCSGFSALSQGWVFLQSFWMSDYSLIHFEANRKTQLAGTQQYHSKGTEHLCWWLRGDAGRWGSDGLSTTQGMFSVIDWCKGLWHRRDLWQGGHLCAGLGLERGLLPLLGPGQQGPPRVPCHSPESPGEGTAEEGEQQHRFLITGKKKISRSSWRRARSRIQVTAFSHISVSWKVIEWILLEAISMHMKDK